MEPNEALFSRLEQKRRCSTLFLGCLSTRTTPQTVMFNLAKAKGGIIVEGKRRKKYFKHCRLEIHASVL